MTKYYSLVPCEHSLIETTNKNQIQHLDTFLSRFSREYVKLSSYTFLFKFFYTMLQIRIVNNFKILTRIIAVYFKIVVHM